MSDVKRKLLTQLHYSESFKKMLVEEYESGTKSLGRIQRKYYIKGHSTLSNWVKKYGVNRYLPPKIKVIMDNEYYMKESKMKELQQRIIKLEKALADEYLEKKCIAAEYQAYKEIQGELESSQVEKKSLNIEP